MNGKLDDTIPEPEITVFQAGEITAATQAPGEADVSEVNLLRSKVLRPGTIIDGSYEILSWIGAGGMGNVYRVRQASLNKELALKTLNLETFNQSAWTRFQNEAKAIARLNHPNIVTIYNLGIDHGNMPYYVMDLLTGETFSSLLARNGPMDYRQALSLFIEVCAGIGFAHKHGIIHRDIKPENLLLLSKPTSNPICRLKIFDFGIAKLAGADGPDGQRLTRAGDIFGSPLYMSPEQGSGLTIDARSDTYSLGCTLFEILSGRTPFHGATAVETIMLHQTAPIPSLQEACARANIKEIPDMLETIMETLLAKSPKDRYQTTELLANDLQAVLDGHKTTIRPHFSTPEIELPGPQTSMRQRRRLESSVDNNDEYPSITKQNQGGIKILSLTFATVLLLGAAAYLSLKSNSLFKTNLQSRTAASENISAGNNPGQKSDEIKNEYDLDNQYFDKALPQTKAVRSRSLSDQTPFCSTVVKDGLLYKCFNFPDDIKLGAITGRDNICQDAMGKILIRADEPVSFWIDESLLRYPQYANRFHNGDIDNLFIGGKHINHEVVGVIAKFRGLSQLNILKCPELTASDLHLIKVGKSTDQFAFGECGFSADDVAAWPEIMNVHKIICVGEKSTDNLLKTLSSPRKQTLQLHLLNSTVSRKGLEYLAKQPQLTYLDLRAAQFSISDIKLLKSNINLDSIDLGNHPLSKTTIEILKDLPQLKRLIIVLRSNQDRALLQKELPRLQIKPSIPLPPPENN